MEQFKVGDIVVLKSGGPRMTITRKIGQGTDTWQGKTNEQVLKIQGYKDGDLICVFSNHTISSKKAFFRMKRYRPRSKITSLCGLLSNKLAIIFVPKLLK